MQVIHYNIGKPVKTIKNAIVDIVTREVITLKAIHHKIMGTDNKTRQFTGFIA